MYNETIIHGTMRTQDLVPVLADKLHELSQHLFDKVFTDWEPPGWWDDTHPWWDSEECADVLNDLFDRLNECAPEGYYFGAHPGDGSDFGFWEIDEE